MIASVKASVRFCKYMPGSLPDIGGTVHAISARGMWQEEEGRVRRRRTAREGSRSEADGCEGRTQKGSGRLRRKTAEKKQTAVKEDSRKEADGCEGRQQKGS